MAPKYHKQMKKDIKQGEIYYGLTGKTNECYNWKTGNDNKYFTEGYIYISNEHMKLPYK